MLHEIDLKELAAIDSPERAILSVYVSKPSDLADRENKLSRIRTLLEDSEEELEHFERAVEMLEAKLQEVTIEQAGLCLFVCYALNMCRVYQLPAEVPFIIRIDAAPYIRPLARLQDEYEDFLIVAADNSEARIFNVVAEMVSLEANLKGDVKNRVKKGGMSQQRYSRRRENQIKHYCDEIAEVLEDLVRKESTDRIVLMGAEETLVALEKALSAELMEKVIGRKGADFREGEDALVEEAYEQFFAKEEADEGELWKQIRNAYKSDGLAALGAGDVLQAVMVGRVETLLINVGAKPEARRCGACENISVGGGKQCEYCGQADVFPVDLIDELSRQAEKTGAELEFADPELPVLAKLDGVAALLRY